MSGGSLDYVYFRIGEAVERIKEELALYCASRPPLLTKEGVALYEISEDRKCRKWWNSTYRFGSFKDADEYFSQCIYYEILERNTLPDGNKQLIMRADGTLYDVHSYTYQEYEADADGNVPYFPEYKEETIRELRKGLDILRQAEVYARRIEWLLSGDDGDESFIKRLHNDLAELKDVENERRSE